MLIAQPKLQTILTESPYKEETEETTVEDKISDWVQNKLYLRSQWSYKGNCSNDSVDMFPSSQVEQSTVAAKVCQGCKVQKHCLSYALAFREEWGVWGGTTESERKVLSRHIWSFISSRRDWEEFEQSQYERFINSYIEKKMEQTVSNSSVSNNNNSDIEIAYESETIG